MVFSTSDMLHCILWPGEVPGDSHCTSYGKTEGNQIAKAIVASKCPMAELVTASDCYNCYTSEGPEFEPLWDSFLPQKGSNCRDGIITRVRASLRQVIVFFLKIFFDNLACLTCASPV